MTDTHDHAEGTLGAYIHANPALGLPCPDDALHDRVSELANKAANLIDNAVNLSDEGARDVMNLMVNATAHLVTHPDATIEEIIAANYGEESSTVLGWCEA